MGPCEFCGEPGRFRQELGTYVCESCADVLSGDEIRVEEPGDNT